MSNKNCGCSSTQSQSSSNGEFLLVKATGTNAGTCGDIDLDSSINENCAKQDPMFDFSKSDFIVPLPSSITQMEVCNSDIYSIEMWLQFLNPIVTLNISNITGNILTLRNRCPDGSAISSNPNAGAAIARGTKFVVCDAPICNTNADTLEAIQEALASASEVCVPAMEVSSSQAIIHPVGRVESDSLNSSAGKCLKRIYGFLFNGGTPVLSDLELRSPLVVPSYRRIVKNIFNNEIVELQNYSEYPQASPTHQKALSVMSTGERLIGPVRFVNATRRVFYENDLDNDYRNWPLSSNTEISKTIDISDWTCYESIRLHTDNIYVQIQLDVCLFSSENYNKIAISANDSSLGQIFANDNDITNSSFTTNIKVDDSDKNIKLKFNGIYNFRIRYKVTGIAYYL